MSPVPGPHDLSAQQLRAVLDGIVDAVMVTDPDGVVLYENAAAASLEEAGARVEGHAGEATVRPLPSGDVDGGRPLSVVTVRDAAGPRGPQDRYRIAFEAQSAPTLIVRLDDGIVLDANEELASLVGSTRERTIGRSLADLRLLPALGDPGAAVDGPVEERVVELRVGDDGDGKLRSLQVATRRIEVEGRRCGILTFVDVTPARQAQEALRALASFGAALESVHGFDELVAGGLRSLIAQLGLDFGTCQRITAEGTRFHAFEGDAPASLRARMRQALPPGLGTMGRVARTGLPHLVQDHRSFANAVPEAVAVGIVTTLTLPVKVGGETAFVLTLGSHRRRVELREDATETAMAYVRRLEHALERAAYLREIEDTRESTFRALGLALEQRELEPRGHMDRVVASSRALALELGLGGELTQALTWGAYLHDVGKIGLSDAVLHERSRPGFPGTDRKNRHTLRGVTLLREVPFLPIGTRQVVRSHHERWDGGGYPDGLAGTAIPLLARAFALVDTFDALTSPRAYRPARSYQAAVEAIVRGSGTQFDPGLVPPFLRAARTLR
jgi:PAS domain S-box-containing protein